LNVPRELRFRDGRTEWVNTPLETAPISRLVKRYRGKPYLIFVDESLRSFFGFAQPNGYLCYAAVGIPEEEYSFLKRSMAVIFHDYESMVVGDSGVHLKEFKFDRFKSLSSEQRADLAGRIQKVLRTYGCFVAAFYARVKGVVMEQVRSGLVGQQNEVPADHQALYAESASELRKNTEDGVAQSETISSILRIPLAGLSYFMRQFECPYRICCDPREAKEDKAVLSAIDNFFSGPMNVLAPEESKLYGGMNNRVDSVDEIGLQIADLLTGEVRFFFENNPELLSVESDHKLITGESREEIEMWVHEFGIYHKYGSLIKIPPDIMQKIQVFSGGSCIPIYRRSFAAGLLGYYTDLGQPRYIELYEGNFFQQID